MNRYTVKTGLLETLMVVIALVFVSPLYILVNVSLKTAMGFESPLAPANPVTFDNFAQAFVEADMLNAFINTVAIAAISLTAVILFSSLAGYGIARLTSGWSRAAFITFLLGLLLPYQLATVPLFQLMLAADLLGTIWSLVLFYTALMMPFSVFLYASFIRSLPTDFEEAAEVDGAGPIRIFFRIVFPMMRAVTGTIIILNVISIWNDFFTPRLFLFGTGTETLIVALYRFVGRYVSEWPVVFGGLIVASAPILILFFILQRYIIRGFAGGVKG
ncbi:carbohydrate ABC transporter permease [Microbacterium sp.]|uniref:carbohydrate ABC transporter permease n=1 Tax=Microbacterium sp. TaxID=51671 RepID=UPI003A8CBC08